MIKNGKIKACIFDMDGTLVDSMPYWYHIGEWYLEGLGIEPDPGLAEAIFDMTQPEAAAYLKETCGLDETEAEIEEGFNRMMEHYYLTEIPLKPGIDAFLDRLAALGIPAMVATVTDRPLAEAVLRRLGVLGKVRGLVTTAEAGAGKHRPDVYLMAAERMGAAPAETMVFEDALYALKTAKRAGFPVCGVYDEASRKDMEEMNRLADRYIMDFNGIRSL